VQQGKSTFATSTPAYVCPARAHTSVGTHREHTSTKPWPPTPPILAHNTTHVQVVVLQAHQVQAQVLVVGRPPLLLLPLVRVSKHVRKCKRA